VTNIKYAVKYITLSQARLQRPEASIFQTTLELLK